MLGLCAQAGLVRPGVVAIDGTRMAGNASRESTLDFGAIAREILADARAWIWKRWQSKETSYLRVSTHDDDGEKQDCSYFIDNYSENGTMQVTLRIHRVAWDQDSPSGPRYKIVEDQIVIANQVQRTEPSADDSQAPQVLSEKVELPSSKYRLHFLDDGTFDLLTL